MVLPGSALSPVMLLHMDETLTLQFSEKDQRDLAEWKGALSATERALAPPEQTMKRQVVSLPAIEASTEKTKQAVEESLRDGSKLPSNGTVKLPKELVENAKATFIASGGNVSEVAALYDLTPESVLRLATQENWPVYGGSTKVNESMSRAQLTTLRDKLWLKLEKMLDAMDVEKKTKDDIVQYRSNSVYVEPLASRSSAFKILMDQYMRVNTLLEPEVFAADPDGTNFHARSARSDNYPGGIEGVNREMADFLSEIVVGVADRIKDRELRGYGDIIDARAQ